MIIYVGRHEHEDAAMAMIAVTTLDEVPQTQGYWHAGFLRGVAHAIAQGATPASFPPQEDERVCLDPAGHPFCLFLE